MAIEDRNLRAGTQLAAKYKGQSYTAEVVEQDGGLRYQLADGRTFKSPSSAGKAVLGGKSCNGWAFWHLATDQAPATGAAPSTPGRRAGTPIPKPQPKVKRGKHAHKEQPAADEAAEPLTSEAPHAQEAVPA